MSQQTKNNSGLVDDSQRAANTKFKITLDDLVALVEKYRQRTYNEDLMYIEELGGIQGLADSLHTNLEKGLIPAIDFEDRKIAFGTNFKEPSKRTPFCRLFMGALEDFMLRLLLVCAVVSIVFDEAFADKPSDRTTAWIEGAAIFIAVFVVAFVGSYNDYKKEAQFLKLQAISDKDNIATVIRQGVEEKIHFNFVQVGDIMRIRAGMNIPVDGVIVRSSGVQNNESAMTGEPDELKKENVEQCRQKQEEKEVERAYSKDEKNHHDIPSPIILSGTQVATGDGWFLVIVVGKNSCQGKILSKLETRVETTPLQEKLEAIGGDVGKLGMYCALLTIHVLFFRFFVQRFVGRSMDLFGGGEDTGDFYNVDGSIKAYCSEWIRYFIIGITIIVVAVPEGLPLAVMIALAYSVRKMLIDQNFVKRLASCEIMGGANNICSDKTGTLTMNQMTVTTIWAGRSLPVKVNDDKYTFKDYFNSDKHISLFTQALALNTIGTVVESSATEMSMLKMIEKFGIDIDQVREVHLPPEFLRFHFTSKRKRMSTIMQSCGQTEHGYDKRIHIKGASEIVLGACTYYLNQDGQKIDLQDEMKSNLLQIITDYAKGALRTICFGYKDLKQNDGGPTHQDMDEDGVIHAIEKTGFTLIAIVGIKDIIRREVPEAVAKCQRAGITVRMVTGDNKITAMAIAKECNIINANTGIDNDSVMEGPEFYERMGGLICKNCKNKSPCDCSAKDVDEGVKNIQAFKAIWKSLRVLARSRPEDKYLLVTGLRELGDVVAVTGDGTNDAPALKKADVGFAMGITGTDVAKHAADIIVMDDNFASIVKACMWGRNIYDNIRKFLQFQLTVNVVALVTAFIGSCILIQSPLQSIQLLWVNLIMDSLGSLALATELPKEELLSRPPYRRDEYIISRKMVKHILGIATYQIIVIYAIVFGGEFFYPEPDPFWRFERAATSKFVFPGRLYDWDNSPLYVLKYDVYGPSRHMSNVFNIFVILQIFNMINTRKVNDEKNIFDGIFTNMMFVGVWLAIVICQAIIIEFTSVVFEVSKGGLPWQHWLIAIILGVLQWPLDFLLKLVPDTFCPQFGKKQKDPNQVDDNNILALRKNRTSSFQLRNPASGIVKDGSGRQGSLH